MKKTSSPTRSCSHLLLTVTALLFLSIPTNAQWKTHQIFHNGIRLNDSGALSLHPNIPFEIDEPNVVGGRFRVTTTGLVGIGVADPKARLSFNNTYEPKISLYQSGEDMFGFATSKHLLEYHVVDINAAHVFYRDRSPSHEVQKAELMRISGSGNVGIGTTAPSERLEVNGNIKATGKIIADGGIALNNISESMYFAENGDVGIGVTEPTEKLEVDGKIKAEGIRIENGLLSLHPNATFNIDEPGIVGGRFTIGKDGNVGIGVADPKARLSFNNTYEPKISLFDAGNSMYGFATSRDQLEYHIVNDFGAHVFYRDWTVSPNPSVSGNAETKVELMRISGNGNVSIGGVISSSEKLLVAGNIKATGKIIADGGIALNNISESMYFAENGDVGIGVVPGKAGNRKGKLHVKGSFHVENEDNQVFHVSSTKELVFVGNEAYDKWLSNKNNPDSQLFENEDNYSLWVSQGIVSQRYVLSEPEGWDDYVFDSEYKLQSLEELAQYINTNRHLPYIPSAAEVTQEGYSLHEMNRGFLKTIEELTLHTIAQEEKIKAQESKLAQYEQLRKEIEQLKVALATLKRD